MSKTSSRSERWAVAVLLSGMLFGGLGFSLGYSFSPNGSVEAPETVVQSPVVEPPAATDQESLPLESDASITVGQQATTVVAGYAREYSVSQVQVYQAWCDLTADEIESIKSNWVSEGATPNDASRVASVLTARCQAQEGQA